MRYNKITTYDIANGDGVGVVVWCQGCDLHCKGCHNPETWAFDKGEVFSNKELQLIWQELSKPYVKRITFSGGHPLAPSNLDEVTNICRKVKSTFPDVKVWVYTGYLYEDIKDLPIMDYIDILVDGPYIESKRNLSLAFRGSENQRIIDIPKSKLNKQIILLNE